MPAILHSFFHFKSIFMRSFFRKALFAGLFSTGAAYGQLSTATLTASQDLTVNYSSQATNNGATLLARVTTVNTDYDRLIMQFDIASLSIPSNAIIAKAELRLTPSATENFTNFALIRITTTAWTELSNPLTPVTTTSGQVTASSLTGGKRVFDIKGFVQTIVAGTANNGWLLRRNGETTTTPGNSYYSRANATVSNRPTLILEWYIPYVFTGATVNNASTTAASDGSITPTFTNGSGNPSNSYTWVNAAGTTVGTGSTLTGRTYGWYGLKIKGAYDSLYMAFLVGVDCEAVSISFAPGPEYVDDATIRGDITNNQGGNVINHSSIYNFLSSTRYDRCVIRFRLWMDPTISPVTSKLYMYGSNHSIVGTNSARLINVTSNWSEYTVYSSNQPTTSLSIAVPLTNVTTATQNQVVDINPFWEQWRLNNLQNYGLRMEVINFGTSQLYHSSDATTPANRPKIEFLVDDATCDRSNHVLFKKELDGGFAKTFQGNLKFYFREEYKIEAGKKIPLLLYDENSQQIAGIDFNGAAIGALPLLAALPYLFDDNRQTLDLTSYSLVAGRYYVLQLTRSTGEKEYIKFQYVN